MTRNNCLSITGKNTNTKMTLKGFIRNECSINNNVIDVPLEIQNLKILIMNLIILPFIAKQWKKLEENICFLDILNKKIDQYLLIYVNNDYLILYKHLLLAFETVVNQHTEIKNLEKYFRSDKKSISTMIFKTTLVKLKAEYELYNLIVGKPLFNCGESYDEKIIFDILKLLELHTINFDYIKNYIIKKYNLNE